MSTPARRTPEESGLPQSVPFFELIVAVCNLVEEDGVQKLYGE
jgi:hypothetical protein